MKRFLGCAVLVASCLLHLGAGFLDHDEGIPYKWATNVNIAVVNTVVNDSISNAEGVATLMEVIDHYNDVVGSQISLNYINTVPSVANNLATYINFSATGISQQSGQSDCKISNQLSGSNLAVFFDPEGSFFNGNLGILGIASPSLYDSQGNITCAYLLINGPAVTNLDTLKYIILHELGHALNLAHSQINGDLTGTEPKYVPTMFPFIPSNAVLVDALSVPLKLDDQFSFSYLYAPNQLQSAGQITGKIKNRFDQGVRAVNVICRDEVDDDATMDVDETLQNVVSWVSDAELIGNGQYLCGLLPPSAYSVEITPIETAINVWDVNPPYIPSEFYSGEFESFDPAIDLLDSKEPMNVGVETIEDIDIVLNEDGRLENKLAKQGTVFAGVLGGQSISPNISDLEYFMYVPKNANKVTFELKATDPSKDIDLLIRCGSPFSLSLQTVGPLYSEANPTSDQTEIAGTSSTGEETVVVSTATAPKIDACNYHLLVVNYTTSDVPFSIQATIEGKAPSLTFDFRGIDGVPSGSKKVVSRLSALAKGDHFIVEGATFTDSGNEGLAGVTEVELYLDVNQNGSVDEDDLLVGQTMTINGDQFTMSDLNLQFLDEEIQRYLVVYTIPSTASVASWLGVVIFLGLLISIFLGKAPATIVCLMFSMLFLSCAGGGTSNYNISVQDKSDISATALGFGDDFEVKGSVVSSVSDFFNNK